MSSLANWDGSQTNSRRPQAATPSCQSSSPSRSGGVQSSTNEYTLEKHRSWVQDEQRTEHQLQVAWDSPQILTSSLNQKSPDYYHSGQYRNLNSPFASNTTNSFLAGAVHMPPPPSPHVMTFMTTPNASTSVPFTYHESSQASSFPNTPNVNSPNSSRTLVSLTASHARTPQFQALNHSNAKHQLVENDDDEAEYISQFLLHPSSTPTHRAMTSHSLPLPTTPTGATKQPSPVPYQPSSPPYEPSPLTLMPTAPHFVGSLFTPPPTLSTSSVSPMACTRSESEGPMLPLQSFPDQAQTSSDFQITRTSKKRKFWIMTHIEVPSFPTDVSRADYVDVSGMLRGDKCATDTSIPSSASKTQMRLFKARTHPAAETRSPAPIHSSPVMSRLPPPSSSFPTAHTPNRKIYVSVQDAMNGAFGAQTASGDDSDEYVDSTRRRKASEEGRRKSKILRGRASVDTRSLSASTSRSEMVSSGRPKRDSGLSRHEDTLSFTEERPKKKPGKSSAVPSGLRGAGKKSLKGAQKTSPVVDTSNDSYSYDNQNDVVVLYVDFQVSEHRRRGFLPSQVYERVDREQEKQEGGFLLYCVSDSKAAVPKSRVENKQKKQPEKLERIPKKRVASAQPFSSSVALVDDAQPPPSNLSLHTQLSVSTTPAPGSPEIRRMSAKALGKQRVILSPESESLFDGEEHMTISDVEGSVSAFEEPIPRGYEIMPSMLIDEDDFSSYIHFGDDNSPTSSRLSAITNTSPRTHFNMPFASLTQPPGSVNVHVDFNYPSSSNLDKSLYSGTLESVPRELDNENVTAEMAWFGKGLDPRSASSVDPFIETMTRTNNGTINPTALLPPEYDPVLSRDVDALTSESNYHHDCAKEQVISPSPLPSVESSPASSNTHTSPSVNSALPYFEGGKLPPRSITRFISLHPLTTRTSTTNPERVSATTSALTNLLVDHSSDDDDRVQMALKSGTKKNDDGNGTSTLTVVESVDADADASGDEIDTNVSFEDVDFRGWTGHGDAERTRGEHVEVIDTEGGEHNTDDREGYIPDSNSRPSRDDPLENTSQQASSSTLPSLKKHVLWPKVSDEYYCHHCRTKPYKSFMNCSSCSKRYCIMCIVHRYSDLVTFDDSADDWTCFLCENICKCDLCCRRRNETYIKQPFPNVLPPIILGGKRVQLERIVPQTTTQKRKPKPKSKAIMPKPKPKPKSRPKPDYDSDLSDVALSHLPRRREKRPEAVLKRHGPAPIVVSETLNEPLQPWGMIYDFSGQRIARAFATNDDAEEVFAEPLPDKPKNPLPPPTRIKVFKKRSKIFIGAVPPNWNLTKGCLVKFRHAVGVSASTSTPQDDGSGSGIKRTSLYIGRQPPKKILRLSEDDNDDLGPNADLFGNVLDDTKISPPPVSEDADIDVDVDIEQQAGPSQRARSSSQLFASDVEVKTSSTINDVDTGPSTEPTMDPDEVADDTGYFYDDDSTLTDLEDDERDAVGECLKRKGVRRGVRANKPIQSSKCDSGVQTRAQLRTTIDIRGAGATPGHPQSTNKINNHQSLIAIPEVIRMALAASGVQSEIRL